MDTYCMNTMPLSQFGKTFNLKTEKDVMPYKLYTNENVQKRKCTVEEAIVAFKWSNNSETSFKSKFVWAVIFFTICAKFRIKIC